jgi:hypothetical protein
MGMMDSSEAFLRAFESADCETLESHIREWFARPYRTPENSIDVAACMHTAMIAAFIDRETECRSHWRDAEAERWRQARQNFDAGMRGFLEAVGKSPKPEPYHGEASEQPAPRKPAIGSGWRIPEPVKRGRGRPRKTPSAWGNSAHA